MIKYYIREKYGETKEVSLEEFITLMRREFIYGSNYYYEHTMMLLGHGQKLVGATHMFWVEW